MNCPGLPPSPDRGTAAPGGIPPGGTAAVLSLLADAERQLMWAHDELALTGWDRARLAGTIRELRDARRLLTLPLTEIGDQNDR